MGFSVLVVWTALLFGCVKDLPIDPQTTDHAVVNCVLTNTDVQYLSISQSVGLNNSYVFREIKNARAVLLTNDDTVGWFVRQGYDDWRLVYRPEPGTVYKLEVYLPDSRILKAATEMPVVDIIEQIPERDAYPTKNFVQLSSSLPCWAFVFTSDVLFDDILRPPSASRTLRSQIGTDHPWADSFNRNGSLLDFLPQATTPAYDYYVRIAPSTSIPEEGMPFCIQTSFGLNSMVCFRAASAEYDQYLKTSLQKMNVYTDEEDPARWFDESRIYSNITNGVGIFAAYSDICFYYNDFNN